MAKEAQEACEESEIRAMPQNAQHHDVTPYYDNTLIRNPVLASPFLKLRN